MIEPRLSLPANLLHRLERGTTRLLGGMPGFEFFRDTADSQVPATFDRWAAQRLFGVNGTAYWPMHPTSMVSYVKRIRIGVETSPGWSPGCYIHGYNGIAIGDYTQISANVGLMSGNHDPYDLSQQLPAPPIIIGKYCLLGMGCVIMPGVVLGDYTMVGSNTVVTKSFPEGFVALGGTPARVIRQLDRSLARDYKSERPYNGYIPAERFDAYCREHLQVSDLPG
jgi:acetyltransferase-like isoleucine patch superfamily enzyme